MELLSGLRERLSGPPPRLPDPLDHLSERWWRLPPRARGVIAALAVLALLAGAGLGAARSPWGEGVEVQVAARALPAGHEVTAEDITTRRWPSAVAPPSVEVVGRRLGVGVPAGSVLRAGHLDEAGPAAGLAPGQVAVPLPTDSLVAGGTDPVPAGGPRGAGASEGGALAGLQPGRHLDLLAGDASGGRVLARAARVLAVADGHVWLAVARDAAPQLAAAGSAGAVTVALLPPEAGSE